MDKYKGNPAKFYLIVISGIVLYVALDALVQSLPPHYSPISQAESDLAVGEFGFIMTINFLLRGLLTLTFIFAFLRTLDIHGVNRSQFRAGTYLLGVWGAGALTLAVFPTDVPEAPLSAHGEIHLVVALIAFIGGAFGTLAISRKIGQIPVLSGLKRIAIALSLLAVILCVIEVGLPLFAPHLSSRIGGLAERLFLGSVLAWMGFVSAFFIRNIRLMKAMPNQA
ncbi:MAG: DUF998 domain-containing protein [Nitrososphaerales archaeon]